MGGEANIWNPRTLIEISADTKRVTQRFTATEGQTLFNITEFAYALGTGALAVYKNGDHLTDVQFAENTSTSFSLVVPVSVGDQIEAVGYVGITANVDVRDTDIFLNNNQQLRDYAGTETTIYIKGSVTAGDGGETFFQKFTGAALGTYVDDDKNIIVPTGGDGSIGWVRSQPEHRKYPFAVDSIATAQLLNFANYDRVETASYLAGWAATIAGPKGGAIYASDGTTGTPSTLYTNRDGFYDLKGKGFKIVIEGELNVYCFGAIGDGTTDDTLAIKAGTDVIQAAGGNATLEFNAHDTYLISYQGAPYADTYGYVVCDFSNVKNVTLKGNGCTIKCINHDITANGGFLFAKFSDVQNPKVKGFTFDMTFTGANTSASFYPFCGGVVFIDSADGTKTQDQLCSNVKVRDLNFKLYHEKGSYQQSANPFAGDPNNGYKVFSVFASGDRLGTSYANQNRGFAAKAIRFLEGHNGYGIWTWAYNDVRLKGISAESWVSKYSTSAGAVGTLGIPMIRYHQWYCSGLNVDGIYFRAKPCSERTTVGFEGQASMINVDTNLTGDYSHGVTNISNVELILGHGDAANSMIDYGIHMFHYGVTNISNISCDATTETTNANSDFHIRAAPEVGGADGFGTLNISNVTFSINCNEGQNISIDNGASTAAKRRLKQVNIDNVTSYAQGQSVLKIGNTSTAYGMESLNISNLSCDGANSGWDPANSNSRALQLNTSETDDTITINGLNVRNKYYVATTDNVNCALGNFTINDLKKTGTTLDYTTAKPVVNLTGLDTPEGNIVANVGSQFRRADGGAATTLYIKETGTGNTGWVAK